MHNEDDYVKVEGDFYHAGDVNYNDLNGTRVDETFTAGTLEIGKGFYQIRSNESPVRAAGTHRFLAKGSSGHTVSFANRDNYIAALETEGGASIDWQGWFNVAKLGSDVTIHAVDEDGISIRSENGRMDFYGHKLTVDGNVATIVGKLYIGGASLAEGGSGSRPSSMGSLTVDGNILQPEGAVVIDGGALTVTGDYRIQSRNSDGTYGESNGALAMNNEDDYVKIQGDYIPKFEYCDISIVSNGFGESDCHKIKLDGKDVIFWKDDIETLEGRQKMEIGVSFPFSGKASTVKYKVCLFKLSPEFYRYYKGKSDSMNNDFVMSGFAAPTFTYTNIIDGMGILAAINGLETDWFLYK
jgi:hypothetical protein